MNLEQRVQALEQEVQLLKAQIQATLLDIREQMLNQTYPSLQGEAPARPAAAPPAEPPAPAPFQKVKLAEPVVIEDEDDDPPDVSMFRKIVPSSTPTPTPAEEAPKPAKNYAPSSTAQPQPFAPQVFAPQGFAPQPAATNGQRETNPYDWIDLENWVSQKVEKLGIERTRELIYMYAQQERFTDQEQDLLLQFVDVYESTEKPAQASRQQPAHKPAASSSIVPQTRAVVDEIRAELRLKQAAAQAKKELSKETLTEQQGLVLRLIAGILNAGDDAPPASTGSRKR